MSNPNGLDSQPSSPSTLIYTGNRVPTKRRLLRKYDSVFFLFQIAINCAVVSLVLIICTLLKIQEMTSLYRFLLVISMFLVVVICPLFGVYKQSNKFYKMALRITLAWMTTVAVLIVLAFLTKASELYSREIIVVWLLVVTVIQIPLLRLNYLAVAYYRKKHTKSINSLVIGLGRTARFFSDKLHNNHWLPDKVIGMVNGYGDEIPDSITEQLTFPVLGEVQNIHNIIDIHKIKRIYISLPLKHAAKVEKLNEQLLGSQVDVIRILDVSDWNLINHSIREVAGMTLMSLNESPENVSRIQIRVKQLMGKSVALMMAIILSPLLIIAAIAVKISSPGPIFFKQKRHGFNGEKILIYKFRSMCVHDDRDVRQTQKGDARITRVGAVIRSSSIDELTQLINVLNGSMSLVGPRPHAVAHNDFYSEKVNKYMARHRIKPGITGLAQISGCRGQTETVEKMAERVKYDMEYVNNQSLVGDIKILIKTPLNLIGKDIY